MISKLGAPAVIALKLGAPAVIALKLVRLLEIQAVPTIGHSFTIQITHFVVLFEI